jgi:hypothetical protein
MNNMKQYKPKVVFEDSSNIEQHIAAAKMNFEYLRELDAYGKAKNKLLWRFIVSPQGDGKCFYQVVKENKLTCTVRICTAIDLDNWTIPTIGVMGTMMTSKVKELIRQRELLEELFLTNQIY